MSKLKSGLLYGTYRNSYTISKILFTIANKSNMNVITNVFYGVAWSGVGALSQMFCSSVCCCTV